LLISIIETGGRGTEVFSNHWVFYKLIGDKLKRVLAILKGGYQEGWGMLFKREYNSEMWPYFYSKPNVGFTYYIKYQGDSVYYDSKIQKEPRFIDLFTIKKSVLFSWNAEKREYVLNKKCSQLNDGQIQSIFNDGEKEFYAKFRWRIKLLQFFGDKRQKEWAQVFERVVAGKTETVWNEAKGSYEEVTKKAVPVSVEVLSIGNALDTLRYYELKIGEVEVEMSYFLGWQPDDKKMMAIAAKEAVAKLDEIKKSINRLKLPKETKGVKDYYLSILYGLKLVYTSIESKTPVTIDKEFKEMRELSEHIYEKEARPIFDIHLEKLPKDFISTTEEIKFAQTKEDKGIYIKAVKLMEAKDWKAAYDMFKGLLPKYKGSAFEKCIMLRITDCMRMEGSDVGAELDAEKMLSEIANSKEYNPVLGEGFAKWRSVYQEMNHGMSNFSVIPNDEYNEKRWELAKVIKAYIKDNPNDLWAKAQLRTLLSWPNIARGQVFGNDNLYWIARFYYPDVFEDKGKEKEPLDKNAKLAQKTTFPVKWTKEVSVKDVGEIGALQDRPVDLSRACANCELELTDEKDEKKKVKIKTCKEYWDYLQKGYYAYTTYDITMQGWFRLDCGILQFLEKAAPSKISYLNDFTLSKESLRYMPASLIVDFGGTSEEARDAESQLLSDLGDKLEITQKDKYNLSLKYKAVDTENSIKLLAWGDYNRDGIEDILVYLTHHYIGGSGRSYESVVLTRKSENGKLIVLDYLQ